MPSVTPVVWDHFLKRESLLSDLIQEDPGLTLLSCVKPYFQRLNSEFSCSPKIQFLRTSEKTAQLAKCLQSTSDQEEIYLTAITQITVHWMNYVILSTVMHEI